MPISPDILFDQLLHTLVQPIVRVNRAYLPAKPDDSHTNLSFDPIQKHIYGRWITLPNNDLIVALDIDTLTFHILDKQLSPLHTISTIGKAISEINFAFSTYLATLKLDVSGFNAPLHYEIPQYFKPDKRVNVPNKQEVDRWCFIRGLANLACSEFITYLQGESEIRIWPHHFDTGVYVQLVPNMGIGFGYAMKDALLNEPYFYFAGYSSEEISYLNLPDLAKGRWIVSEQWKGAAIPMSALSFCLEELKLIREFIQAVGEWYLSKIK
jgi:hypothetical protein